MMHGDTVVIKGSGFTGFHMGFITIHGLVWAGILAHDLSDFVEWVLGSDGEEVNPVYCRLVLSETFKEEFDQLDKVRNLESEA